MQSIRVIQIGIGHDHALPVLRSLTELPAQFELLGLAVPDGEAQRYGGRLRECAALGVRVLSVQEALALPGVQAAVVETEEAALTETALLCARQGLHVHMDKPGGMDLAAFGELTQTLRRQGLVFSTGYMYRHNPLVQEAFRKVKQGELGEVYCVEAHMDCEHTPEKRQWLSGLPGGMMFFLGCHLVDLIYRLQGEPEEVLPMHMSTGFDGVTAEDYGMTVFRYSHGVSFAKTCANECGGLYRRQLVICGTRGTLELKPLEVLTDRPDWLYTEMRQTPQGESWGYAGQQTRSALFHRYAGMLEQFARMAAGEAENPYSYDYEYRLYRLLLRACGKTE